MTLKKDWQNIKKDLTWYNILTGAITSFFPMLVLYGFGLWMNALTPIVNKYNNPKTPEELLLYLCIVIAFVAPIFLMFPSLRFGFWICKILGLDKDRKTRWILFDDVSYYIRDMRPEQREKIREILADYRSKEQLRKDAKKNQSWWKRNFS